MIHELRTDRLLLRPPDRRDLPAYCEFYADAAASGFYGGPLSSAQAWRRLAADIGHWTLRGFGMWTVIEPTSGDVVGGCGIVWPEGWPRHELSWWIMPRARRRGYAEEASRAVIGWAGAAFGWTSVETHMKDDNSAARALAEKLGGKIIAREQFPDGLTRNVYAIAIPERGT
jgi:RimJ/RimL family protein N-acetyltransferase